MSDLFWLTDKQLRRIEPYFPLSHGIPRVDDRRVISGIIFVIRNGLRWRDAPIIRAHQHAAGAQKKRQALKAKVLAARAVASRPRSI